MNGFRSILLPLLLVLGACGDDPDPMTPGVDTGDVGITDTADGGADSGADAATDSGTDTTDDATPDTDTAPDSDTTPDVDPDAGPDVAPGPTEFCEDLAITVDSRCQVEAGSSALLLRGDILAPATVYEGGSILIGADGRIECVGCNCADQAGDATVVTCPDGVISPGLVNGHDHLTFTDNAPADTGQERFDHRHDWRRGIRGHDNISVPADSNSLRVAWGEMRQVMIGTTSVAGSGGAPGWLRNLDRSADANELGQGDVDYDTFPLGDTGGQLRTGDCSYPDAETPDVLDADCYLAHVSEGIDDEARNEFLCLSSEDRGGVDLTERQSTFIHMIGLRAIDASIAAGELTSVIWSPRSNIALYGHTAQVTMFRNLGIQVGLGTDWTASGSIHMGRELACADRLNRDHYGGFFGDQELWQMATLDTAAALKVDDALGALDNGLVGDVAIYDGSEAANPYRAVIDAQNQNVLLVLRGGEPLYGESDVMDLIPGTEGCDSVPGGVCGMDATICVPSEVADSFTALSSQNQFSYDAFFCGVPEGEPSCVPFRPDEFDGVPTADDLDGDGIANDSDNCPNIFNAIRPVDAGVQADHDGDGEGDVCDPCPLDAGTTDCTPPNPDDRDADGIDNLVDNCSDNPNPEQNDSDGDGSGDECDPCPLEPNPDGAACTFSIYDIKQGNAAEGVAAAIVGQVTVTAENRLFLQVSEADRDPVLGPDFSGIVVYHAGSMLGEVARGDLIRVSGNVNTFFGQTQLSGPSDWAVLDSGLDDPAPIEVAAIEIATGGARADALEGVLVEVADAEVTDDAPVPGGGEEGDTFEFVVDESLRVNDQFYLITPFPEVGEVLRLRGIVQFHRTNHKLEPRDADDVTFVVARPPQLLPPSIDEAFVLGGTVDGDPYFPGPLVISIDRPAPAGGASIAMEASAGTLSTPDVVIIPEGEYDATVPFTALDATNVGTVTATYNDVTWEIPGWSISTVAEPAPLSVIPEEPTTLVGAEILVEIPLEWPIPPGVTAVFSVSVDGDAVSTLESISAEEFETTLTLPIMGVELGDATITLIGSAFLPLSFDVTVAESASTGLVISEVFYDADTGSAGDDGWEWVELYNGTGSVIDLSALSLGYGGATYDNASYSLSGTIAPGGCFVAGGASTDASNGSPVYDLVQDFAPDIQNAGSRADAIGLFGDDAVPFDAVLYGGANDDGFVSPDGTPFAEPNAPDVGPGSSIERTSEGWREQLAPTPGVCAIAVE